MPGLVILLSSYYPHSLNVLRPLSVAATLFQLSCSHHGAHRRCSCLRDGKKLSYTRCFPASRFGSSPWLTQMPTAAHERWLPARYVDKHVGRDGPRLMESLGAMVLGHSLKDRGAKAPLVAFIVVDKLSSH